MKHTRLRYAIVSLVAVMVLNILFAVLLFLINGPHPECGHNPEVGPCDLVGSSLNFAGWTIVPAFGIWLLTLFVGFSVIWIKQGSKNKVLNGFLLLILIMPVSMMIFTLLMMMKSISSN